MQAEQGLANVALHVAQMHNEVKQRECELRAAARQRRVEAALAGQMPRLQQWQSMQVVTCMFNHILLSRAPEAEITQVQMVFVVYKT